MKTQSIVSAMVILFFVSNSSSAATASFQGLGDLPGRRFESLARAVSADGSVVVGYSISSSEHEAFRWTKATGMVGLGDLPGGRAGSIAYGVSADSSVIVGFGYDASGQYEAFRWENGQMVGLGELPGGDSWSYGVGVSADGSVIAGYSHSELGGEAFRWQDLNGNGQVDDDEKLDNQPGFGLGDLPGGQYYSYANAVSANGSVVVGFGHSPSGREAFRWTQETGMVGLGDLPGGGFESEARGVSADGSVIVGSGWSESGQYEAFRWENGVMIGLGDLPGGYFSSMSLGISADGSVVVGYGVSASGQEAFIWDADSGMRSIQDILVNDFGLDLTGWKLVNACGISADYLTIIGDGFNPNGREEGWIATIPEPTSAVLLGLGGLMLRRKEY